MSLRNAILGFLTIQPLSGYDIKRYFDASVRHFWSADQAAIYRALASLESDELVGHERVEQRTRPDRKVYHVTPAGVDAFDSWLAVPASTVVRREPLLLKLFFASRLAREDFDAILTAELTVVEAELAAFAEIVASIARDAALIHESVDRDEVAAHDRILIGPLITLTNGVQMGVAYRSWLRDLQRQRRQDTLTATALLAGLQRALESH